MFINRKKKYREYIAELEKRISTVETLMQAEKEVHEAKEWAYKQHVDVLVNENKELQTKYRALRQVSKSDQELIAGLKKRNKILQGIVDRHGLNNRKDKAAELTERESDPYIEE